MKSHEIINELKCWQGYHRVKGRPAGSPGSCAKNTNEQAPTIPAAPTGHGQFTTKTLPSGETVDFNPVTGAKTHAGAQGTTTYDVTGKAREYSAPDLGGLAQRTNLDTGEKTTTFYNGNMSASTTPRQDQSTVKTASATIGPATATTASGIGFGGAGANVQQGGNQISSITNAQGQTTNIAGRSSIPSASTGTPTTVAPWVPNSRRAGG